MTRAELAGMAIGALAGTLLMAWWWPPGADLTMPLAAKMTTILLASIAACWLVGRWYSRHRS